MKITRLAVLSGAALMLTTATASAQALCAVGIILAAGYVNAHENRELTSKEAMSCGLSYLIDKQNAANEEEKTPPAKKNRRKHAEQKTKSE